MRIITTKATKLSNVTIDEDLDMGTAGFDILLGAKALKTTDLLLKQGTSTSLYLRNIADDAFRNLYMSVLHILGSIEFDADAKHISAPNADADYTLIKARDNANALVEIARLVGAADPYFQMTLPMRLSPGSVPGAPLEGHFWYDATKDMLMFRNASANRNVPLIKTATYDGNNTDDRQITTGFKCSLVIVNDPAVGTWLCFSTARSIYLSDANGITSAAVDVLLHATDGFVVDQSNANNTGTTYTYFAISE